MIVPSLRIQCSRALNPRSSLRPLLQDTPVNLFASDFTDLVDLRVYMQARTRKRRAAPRESPMLGSPFSLHVTQAPLPCL